MNSKECKILFVSAACALTVGCTSQIDSVADPVTSQETNNPGGIYLGSISPEGASTSTPVTAIFDSTQRFAIYSNDGVSLYSGIYILTTNSSINGSARSYVLSTGASNGSVSFSAPFQSKMGIGGQYTFTPVPASSPSSGLINLSSYQAIAYESPSATKLLEGIWTNQDNFGQYTTQFSISGDGTVSGSSTTTNCSYNGQITTINLNYNVYKVSLNEDCSGVSGAQSLIGLASIFPANSQTATPAQLIMAVASPTEGRLFTLTTSTTP